jgi:PAS domain S-box-containing protein
MDWDLNGDSANAEQALAGGEPQPAGWFRFYFADQRWEWSEQVQRLHGYEPGTITPTTELVLKHKHPEDRGQVAAAIDRILNTHKAFSNRHRIIDTTGQVHYVVVVGDLLHDERGDVIGTHGFYVDVTSASEQEREDFVTARIAEIAEQRACIDQAKGMLMLIYGIGDGAAFDLLKWLSQEHNVKLRLLAERVCADFRKAGPGLASQSEFDHLLLTAHERVGRSRRPKV